MHTSNVWAASVLAGSDLLTEALPPGLGMRDLEALTLLANRAGPTVEWLRTRIGLTQSGTVRLVDRLEALGMVHRRRTGREVGLNVTALARRRLRSWDLARDAAMDRALAGLGPADRDALVHLLATSLLSRPRTRPEADRTCRTCTWPRCEPGCPVDRSVPT